MQPAPHAPIHACMHSRRPASKDRHQRKHAYSKSAVSKRRAAMASVSQMDTDEPENKGKPQRLLVQRGAFVPFDGDPRPDRRAHAHRPDRRAHAHRPSPRAPPACSLPAPCLLPPCLLPPCLPACLPSACPPCMPRSLSPSLAAPCTGSGTSTCPSNTRLRVTPQRSAPLPPASLHS